MNYFSHVCCALAAAIVLTFLLANAPVLAAPHTLQDIINKRELVAGIFPDAFPYTMTNALGEYSGFEVELARQLAQDMGVKITFMPMSMKDLFLALAASDIDVIISNLSITPQRNLRVAFSEPYMVMGQTVLLRKELQDVVTSYKQLNDSAYRLIVLRGSTSDASVVKFMPKANLLRVSDIREGIRLLLDGKGDAWVYDDIFNSQCYQALGEERLTYLSEKFTHESIAIAFSHGATDLDNFLKNFIRQIKLDGRYEQLYNKWFVQAIRDEFKKIQNGKQ